MAEPLSAVVSVADAENEWTEGRYRARGYASNFAKGPEGIRDPITEHGELVTEAFGVLGRLGDGVLALEPSPLCTPQASLVNRCREIRTRARTKHFKASVLPLPCC
jgi:hypothetical protein